uniref:Uncharacterized protein n=1 Tax=Arundo donax TaxID=35708 RepID=A0A0A8YCD3_ARUDO
MSIRGCRQCTVAAPLVDAYALVSIEK